MRPPEPTVENFVEPPSVEEGLSSLRSHFESWEQADGRGKKSLWSLLGKTYEFANQIAGNDFARAKLITEVSRDPTVEGSNRWRAETKHPLDLLLVLLLGLKEETKTTKSQWLRSLKMAQTQNVDPTQDAFFAWMENIGGVDAALKLGRKPKLPKKEIDELAKELPELADLENEKISMPLKFSDEDMPEGLGIIIVRKANEEGDAIPIGTVVNKRQVSEAIRIFLADQARHERKVEKEYHNEQKAKEKAERKVAKAKFNVAKKAKRFAGTFDDFYVEYKLENGDR